MVPIGREGPGRAPGRLGRWLECGWPPARSTPSSAISTGNAERILGALAEAESRPGPTWPSSPSSPSPATRPRTCSAGRRSWPTTGPPSTRIAAATGPCAAVVGYVDTDADGHAGQRRRPVCRGPGARSLREAPAAQLRGLRRAALVHPRGRARRARYVVAGVPVGIDHLRGHVVRRRPHGRPGRGRCPAAGQPQRLPVLAGTPARAAGRAGRPGGRDRLSPSSTSTRSGARTSWSSTGRPWSWAPTGRCMASAAQFAEEVLVADLEIEARAAGGPRRDGPSPVTVSRAPVAGRRAPDRPRWPRLLDPEAEVYEALVLGTRDYLAKNGFDRRRDRAVRRDRLVAGGGGGRRRPRGRPRARGDHALALLERGLGVRRRRPWPATWASTSPTVRHRAGPPGLGRVARPAARAATRPA